MHGRPAAQETGAAPRESHPQRWHILGVLLLALLVTSIDHTVINVAMPRLVGDLGASAAQLQWVVAAYTVVFAGLLLTAGSLGDRFGRRRALLAGISTFLAGSILAALSTSTGMLIAGRGVMGVGGALIMPTTLSILVNAFGSPRERAKAIAIWTAASGAGIALGPIVGGALMRSFSWSSVFWINVPLLALALLGTLHVIPDSRDPNATRLDPIGALLSIVAIGTTVYAIIEAPSRGWTSTSTIATFVIGNVAVSCFVAWEWHRTSPMLDLRLFRHPAFTAASVTLAMLFFAMAGAVFLQAQYLQFILGYSPLVAGCALVPAALGMVVGTGAGAHLASHVGGRLAVAGGTLVAAVGLAVQAGFIDGTSYLPTGVGLLLFGLGAGMAMPSATDLIMATLPPARAGVGSAVNDTVREIGGALGVAIIGSIAATRYTSSLHADLARFPDLTRSARSALSDNVGAALTASHRVVAHGHEIASLARGAFIGSMTGALWIGVAMAVGATVVALALLPRHAAPTPPTPHRPAHHRPHRAASAERHLVSAGHRRGRSTTTALLGLALLGIIAGCGRSSADAAPTSRPESTTTSTTVVRPSTLVDTLVTVHGARLHVSCVGHGSVTVVLIAGFGDAGTNWTDVTPTISRTARVCSYARFGTGTSDPPPSTQTFSTEARDLRAALRSIGEPGPFVVVGHSYGGAEAVMFASLFRRQVRGLLLLDASPATWDTASCAVPDDGSKAADDFRQSCAAVADPANNPERLDGPSAFGEVATVRSLGDLPMAVLTADVHQYAGLDAAEAARLNDVWDAGQRDWAAVSTDSTVISVEDTSHYIQLDRPDVVIEQIQRLLPHDVRETSRSARSTTTTTTTTSRDATQRLLDAWTSRGPGGVTAAIVRHGHRPRLYASGIATPDGRPMAADDQIRIGSISKTLVAVMILQLVDDDEIALDEPVTRYAPELTIADGVTVRQLLTHASGIPDTNNDRFSAQVLADMGRTWSSEDMLGLVAGQPRDFAPGTDHRYSNTNYIVAGLLLEHVTGASLADNLRTRIARPLGLAATYLAPAAGRTPIPGFSPYLPGGTTLASPYTAIESSVEMDGGMVSTAAELATVLEALANGSLISQQALDEMTSGFADQDFGIGVSFSDRPAGRVIEKRGAVTGFDCLVGFVPDTGDIFVVLTNDDSRDSQDLADQILATWHP